MHHVQIFKVCKNHAMIFFTVISQEIQRCSAVVNEVPTLRNIFGHALGWAPISSIIMPISLAIPNNFRFCFQNTLYQNIAYRYSNSKNVCWSSCFEFVNCNIITCRLTKYKMFDTVGIKIVNFQTCCTQKSW